jgi:GNAT superfamily N-acetyltransferase
MNKIKVNRPYKNIRHKKDYASNFLTREHQPIKNIAKLKKYNFWDMFLFYKGVFIGEGGFEIVNKCKGYYQTEGVSLQKEHRKKGHGIHLYFHLIETATRSGAKRLYSSTTLNKFSRRMWRDKLPKFYKVIPVHTKKECYTCGSCEKRVERYYIDLKKG